MQISNYKFNYLKVLLLALFSFASSISEAQSIDNYQLDSLTTTKKINVADITILLSETDFKANIILNELKNDKSLVKLKKDNDSIVSDIKNDLKLFAKEEQNLPERNNRRLGNTLVFWEQDLAIINNKILAISNIIKDQDKNIHDFEKEKISIKYIIKFLKDNNESYTIQRKANSVKSKIDKIITDLNDKKNYSVKILNKLIETKSEVVTIVDNIKKLSEDRRTSIAGIDQESLLGLNYTDKDKWDISGINLLLKGEYNRLKTYSLDNIWVILFHLLTIVLCTILFIYLKNNPVNSITTPVNLFKLYYFKLTNMPKSLGVTIGLLLFVGAYTTPPLVFIDAYRFLFILPLLLLLRGALDKEFRFPIYIFIISLMTQITYTFIPEETIYSRILLFSVSAFEVVGITWVWIYFRKKKNASPKILIKLAFAIITLYLITAVIAFVANIIGMISFSEILLTNIISSILAIILMTLLLIVSNGIIIYMLESDTAGKINSIRKSRSKIIKVSLRLTNIIVSLMLAHLITHSFGIEDRILEQFMSIVNYPIGLGSITFSIGGVFTFFFVIWMSIIVSQIIKNVLEEDVLTKINVESGLNNTISMSVKYSIITLGFFIAISAAGIPLSQMAIIFSAFGVGIGFGLQNIFNNLVSGFILLFERPIKIGDTVEVGTLVGQVKSIGIRSSKVRTFDGAEIIVPNGNLISNEVINWTLSDRKRRVEVIVGISYDSDPHIAKEIFLDVLKNHPLVVTNPEPLVYFRELGESSLDFRLLFWTFSDWVKVRSEIIFGVFDALKEAGIEIPFPQQDLHLRSIDDNVELKHKSKTNKSL